MSSYSAPAWHPVEKRVRNAYWIDDYFGKHKYGVQFDGAGPVYRAEECEVTFGRTVISGLKEALEHARARKGGK